MKIPGKVLKLEAVPCYQSRLFEYQVAEWKKSSEVSQVERKKQN